MRKVALVLVMLCVTPALGNDQKELGDRFSSLVSELHRIRVLNNEYSKIDPGNGRYRFRYDLVDKGLRDLIFGVESHMAAMLEEEKINRLREEK